MSEEQRFAITVLTPKTFDDCARVLGLVQFIKQSPDDEREEFLLQNWLILQESLEFAAFMRVIGNARNKNVQWSIFVLSVYFGCKGDWTKMERILEHSMRLNGHERPEFFQLTRKVLDDLLAKREAFRASREKGGA